MMDTPLLDIIAGEECLKDSTRFSQALRELDAYHDEALCGRGLKAELRCTTSGWLIAYGDGYNQPSVLTGRYGAHFACAEDAIQALRQKVDGWIAEARAEETACTCPVPSAGL